MNRDLLPGEKLFTESTHRSRAPVATFAAYEHLMPRLGITRLANITGLDCIGIPVVVAFRPESRGLATSQGKGVDLISAKVSALMESIETWHAERIEAVTRVDPLYEMQREGRVIDVTGLPLYRGKVLHEGAPISWILAHELMEDKLRWVPWDAVSCDFTTSVVRNSTFLHTTNGLASGNQIPEAIVHGLCELIERDAITLHQYVGGARKLERKIDLNTIDHVCCKAVLRQLADAGVDVVVWDCTSDVGVPVFSTLIVDSPAAQRWPARGPFRGYGCHPIRGIALLRSLTEAVQSRLTYISGSRDDLFPERYRALQRMEEDEIVSEDVRHSGTRDFHAVPEFQHSTFHQDLDELLHRLRAVGIREVAVFDLTREDNGVPVVKVLAPGLENNIHRDANYCPGRRVLGRSGGAA
jgi:YcaO-like protein with predicted kinase domain